MQAFIEFLMLILVLGCFYCYFLFICVFIYYVAVINKLVRVGSLSNRLTRTDMCFFKDTFPLHFLTFQSCESHNTNPILHQCIGGEDRKLRDRFLKTWTEKKQNSVRRQIPGKKVFLVSPYTSTGLPVIH